MEAGRPPDYPFSETGGRRDSSMLAVPRETLTRCLGSAAGEAAVLEAQAVNREVPHADPGAPGARRDTAIAQERLQHDHEEVPAVPGGNDQYRQSPKASSGMPCCP